MNNDNRINLQVNKIDFNLVGMTGQDHDNYPPEGGQARFDHMRIFLIGLLSNQSSINEPSEKRDGTLWFDMNTRTIKIYSDNQWKMLSEAIAISEQNDDVITLSQWYQIVNDTIQSSAPPIVFNGVCTLDSITQIFIPLSLKSHLYHDSRAFVYINGILVDPRNAIISPSNNPSYIQLSGSTINKDDNFTVEIKRIPPSTFYFPTISIP